MTDLEFIDKQIALGIQKNESIKKTIQMNKESHDNIYLEQVIKYNEQVMEYLQSIKKKLLAWDVVKSCMTPMDYYDENNVLHFINVRVNSEFISDENNVLKEVFGYGN